MSVPSFFSRVADSLRPVAEVDPATLAVKLEHLRLHVHLQTADPAAQRAFALAVNLAARLYPHIDLSAATGTDIAEQAQALALRINPLADVRVVPAAQAAEPTGPAEGGGDLLVRLCLGVERDRRDHGSEPTGADGSDVTVTAAGWTVYVDPTDEPTPEGTPDGHRQDGHPLAWLAAAAFGMSEVFRQVFATELDDRGRRARQPGSLDLLNTQPSALGGGGGTTAGAPLDVGDVYLVGAGAIGQAATYALASLPLTGTLHVVDPETITLSNLQRYVLTDNDSVNGVKVDLVAEAFAGHGLRVDSHQGKWGQHFDHVHAQQVLVALDTPLDRIGVAATLPHHAYNAWTQVHDLGWSRHEHFGVDPCLACLYYPSGERPSDHELIANALGQDPLRILGYLTFRGAPIGVPLPGIPELPTLPRPDGADRWLHVSLMTDLLAAGVIRSEEQGTWFGRTVGSLYRDGICAGGLLPVGDLPGDVLVPLAHQSVLSGVMLAAELVWASDPELARRRDQATEHRFDVLRGFPQVVARPRQRTDHCLCSDTTYLEADSAPTRDADR